MPDPFSNARPYFDVSFPSSGDSFQIAGFRNAFSGLGFMDMIPLQPRAHNPPDRKIMVRGQDASSYFNPVYFGNADQRIPFASGDTATMNAPVSNPRIDIVYLTPSGDIRVQTGTEAAVPTLPSLSPSGDTRFPICAVWHKVNETKVVNFEDKDSNSGDGYIYKDLRPWMRSAGAGATSLTSLTTANPTGDNVAGTATTAARADHHHQGIHTSKIVGSGDMFGDVEFAGSNPQHITQQGNRLTFDQDFTRFKTVEFKSVINFSVTGLLPGKRYKLIIDYIQNTSAGNLSAQFNGDGGANYSYSTTCLNPAGAAYNPGSTGTGQTSILLSPCGTEDAAARKNVTIEISPAYNSNNVAFFNALGSNFSGGTFGGMVATGRYDGASAIASVQIAASAGTMTGSYTLYRMN